MSTQQLKIDLHQRTRERMHKMICDTFDLYEMAQLQPSDAVVALADVLINETAKILSSTDARAEEVGTVVAAMVRYQRGEISQREMARRISE